MLITFNHCLHSMHSKILWILYVLICIINVFIPTCTCTCTTFLFSPMCDPRDWNIEIYHPRRSQNPNCEGSGRSSANWILITQTKKSIHSVRCREVAFPSTSLQTVKRHIHTCGDKLFIAHIDYLKTKSSLLNYWLICIFQVNMTRNNLQQLNYNW